METLTAWVKPPRQIGGLDHLAVQAPCINIYGRLLPGITNVTDRARYYTFYPWLIWALEQSGFSKFDEDFIDAFRKADGLFTLIAHQHAAVSGDAHEKHAGATVGSANLSSHINKIRNGGEIKLSDFAHRDSAKQPYFKNKLGGLGQYYLGVLAELSILDGTTTSGIRYTRQFGMPLVEAIESGVPRELFVKTIKENKVNAERLNELSAFCPCRLTESKKEQELLIKLFFAHDEFDDVESIPRRRTLQMLLDLADNFAKHKLPLDSKNFRGSVYAEAMPDGTEWKLGDDLHKMRSLWGVYERNELLSISIQGLFYALLDAYQESGLSLDSGNSVAEWFVKDSGELKGVKDLFGDTETFQDIVSKSNEWLPQYRKWGDKNHEVAMSEKVITLCSGNKSAKNREKIVESSIKILIALASREESEVGYDTIQFPGNYLQAYPINLQSFLRQVKNTWGGLTLDELLIWLCSKWGVDNHLRVALRKLRGQSQSTFRIRPSDDGLKVIEIPQAVHTSPRFNQAIQVLKDVGLLESEGSIIKSTTFAQQYKG